MNRLRVTCLLAVAGLLAACSSAATPSPSGPLSSSSPHAAVTTTSAPRPKARPVIVLDPGHSVKITKINARTGLDVSDYENEPEMSDVYAVALLVKTRLVAAGYRVYLTKATDQTPTTLAARSHLANTVHAALAVSIHDQAGAHGGIGFRSGNNIVYYQTVGNYRETPSGKRVTFTNARVAALSRKYAGIFRQKRAAAQQTAVKVLGNIGYNMASRGLPAGNIWMVQLLSDVPWIYNEAGGNSAGMVGLSAADQATYAAGLVASVEACVPVGR